MRAELIEEQFGLCGYTGAPVDERLSGFNDSNLAFQAHIEHVKPRRVCQTELEERKKRKDVYGRELCEDMDHRNLIAALEVKRKPPADAEIFGAAAHGDELLPITPLQPDCESFFRYGMNGEIVGNGDDAASTIRLLRLDHATLTSWRRGAIAAFFPTDEILSREEVEQRIHILNTPVNNKLAEFSFCIAGYARELLSK
ncbi:hypothetical protein NA78x_000016 [Anatilimnocola sp. NA78]|uniref:hypothetical protein n=1 Tax=Anatilimnocola sp. NA78 TaxID=3415683 RepID=UPI003CE45866